MTVLTHGSKVNFITLWCPRTLFFFFSLLEVSGRLCVHKTQLKSPFWPQLSELLLFKKYRTNFLFHAWKSSLSETIRKVPFVFVKERKWSRGRFVVATCETIPLATDNQFNSTRPPGETQQRRLLERQRQFASFETPRCHLCRCVGVSRPPPPARQLFRFAAPSRLIYGPSDFIKSLIPLVIYTVFDERHQSRCGDLTAALICLFNGVVERKVVTARCGTKRWVTGPVGERWKGEMQSSQVAEGENLTRSRRARAGGRARTGRAS